MQDKAAIGLHRPAKMHRQIFKLAHFQRQLDLRKQFAQVQADGAVHHDAERALLIMLTHIGE